MREAAVYIPTLELHTRSCKHDSTCGFKRAARSDSRILFRHKLTIQYTSWQLSPQADNSVHTLQERQRAVQAAFHSPIRTTQTTSDVLQNCLPLVWKLMVAHDFNSTYLKTGQTSVRFNRLPRRYVTDFPIVQLIAQTLRSVTSAPFIINVLINSTWLTVCNKDFISTEDSTWRPCDTFSV